MKCNDKKRVSNEKIGNRKYRIETVDGTTQWISLCNYKRVRFIKRKCGKLGVTLLHLGNLKFEIVDKNGDKVFSGKHGKSLRATHKFVRGFNSTPSGKAE